VRGKQDPHAGRGGDLEEAEELRRRLKAVELPLQ
jgi:hypothetical protein